jgi:sigma-B regulation protein RsbU (phosphoserine phosphatase)
MLTPVVFPYQRALDEFRREGREPPLLKRMSELISLLDLTTTLSSGLAGEEILDAALLTVMGELQVGRGALYVREADGSYRKRASRGLPAGSPDVLPAEAVAAAAGRAEGPARDALGLELVCPVAKAGKTIALLGFGPRAGGGDYGDEEVTFLRSVAACAATPIENGLIHDELQRVNQRLSVKLFQLHNLFDVSRELTASLDEDSIRSLFATTVMGHFVVSRCAIYDLGPEGLSVVHERGVKSEESTPVPPGEALQALTALRGPSAVRDMADGPVKERLVRSRMGLAVPLVAGARLEGLLAVGERVSGAPFTDEDQDFARTLARQAVAALESARLHRMLLQKQRQDRELQIAREIQQSLFPSGCPSLDGFEVAAESRPCQEVGGDYYDFIPLGGGRLALAVADVSGKGTPASILMASVHASLQALAGTAPPAVVMERVNRFLFASTQANKYVTLFYAELDPATRRLRYVNAGHVPPYRVRGGDGGVERLLAGGPALGLLDEASFEMGEIELQAGDVVGMVTDGVTEALSPADEEFGDERASGALRQGRGETATGVMHGLVRAVDAWTGGPCSDDLTALILKAR